MRSIRDALYAMLLVARGLLTIVTLRRVKRPTREISTPPRIYAWPVRNATPGIMTPWAQFHRNRLSGPTGLVRHSTDCSSDGRS